MEQGLYRPLPGPEFCRLLTLQPGKRKDPVICAVEVVKLSPNLRYEALSYVWNEKIPPSLDKKDSVEYRRKKLENVVICNDHPIRVTENLFAALLQLRHASGREPRTLWIDALCIDQGNTTERGAQVAIMCKIYRGAEHVLVWIGDEDDDVTPSWDSLQRYTKAARRIIPNTAFWLCGIAGRLAGLPFRLVGRAEIDQEIRPLVELLVRRVRPVRKLLSGLEVSEENLQMIDQNLLGRPWFRRVWTLQEIVVSRSAILLYGPFSMRWTDFLQFFNSWNSARATNTENLSHLYHANIIMKAFLDSTLRFSPLLISTWYRNATDPRDRIFALLGLLPEGSYPRLKPDYNLSVPDAFIEATKASIEVDKSLAVLSTAGLRYKAGKVSPDTASWVPDFSNHDNPYKSYTNSSFFAISEFTAPNDKEFLNPVMGPRSVGRELQLRGFVVGLISQCVHDATQPGISLCMKPVHAGSWFDGFEISGCRAHSLWDQSSDIENNLCRAFGINLGWYREGDWCCVLLGGSDLYILRPCASQQSDKRDAASTGPTCSLVSSVAEQSSRNINLADEFVLNAIVSHKLLDDWVDFILV